MMLREYEQLSYSEIRSPIDGVVTDRPLYVGDLATANQPILTVMDLSSLVAKAHIPQSEAVLLKIGDAAQIKVPDVEEAIKGHVSLVSPALDPGSTTIEVWVETRQPSLVLKPGMSVSVEMTAKTVKDAVAVPSPAIYKNADGAYYVLLAGADHKAHQKVVQLGVKNAQLTQVTSGIHAGDPVITSGGYAVPDGTAIEAEKAAAPEKGEAEGPAEKVDSRKKKPASAPPAKDKE